MILTLPFPPSANNLFKNFKGGRAASKRYLAWQEAAGWEIQRNKEYLYCASGPVGLHFTFGKPDKRKRDIDNLLKAPIDLLVKHGVIDDDRNVQSIQAGWGDVEGVRIMVQEL